MGDIGTPYSAAPPAGLILTTGAANLNRDIYSVNGEQGLLSEPNGGLDDANLAAGFEITPEIILDFSYVRATATTATSSGRTPPTRQTPPTWVCGR